jgi:hypothetical protein
MVKCKKIVHIYLQSEQREERVNPAHLAGMTCKLVCLPPAKPVLATSADSGPSADLFTTADQSTASSSVNMTSTEPTSPTTTQIPTTTDSTSTTTEAVVLETTTTLKTDEEQERYICMISLWGFSGKFKKCFLSNFGMFFTEESGVFL